MPKLTFDQRVERFYNEVLMPPRLAHFVGHTSLLNIAVFSRFTRYPERSEPQPTFMVLAEDRRLGEDAATPHSVIRNDVIWTPGNAVLITPDFGVVIPHDRDSGPIRAGGYIVNVHEAPPIPVHELPNTEAALAELLVAQGNTVVE